MSMETKIRITIGGALLTAELNESKVARALLKNLPAEIRMSRWGDEYYGSIAVGMQAESGERDELSVGEIAYWPPGDALCLFFGPTPASIGDEPRAASDIVPLGKIESGVEKLSALPGSVTARIELD